MAVAAADVVVAAVVRFLTDYVSGAVVAFAFAAVAVVVVVGFVVPVVTAFGTDAGTSFVAAVEAAVVERVQMDWLATGQAVGLIE